MSRISTGRAEVLAAKVVSDTYGTAMVLSANTAGSAFLPSGCVGLMVYSPNVDFRARLGNHASTALTNPRSGYFRANTEYEFVLNPSVNFVSLVAFASGTPQLTYLVGAGA